LTESNNYVEHRLRVAGYAGAPLFEAAAIRAIGQFAEGIPRNINNLCFNALSLGCALRERVVSVPVVEEVIADLDINKHVTDVTPRTALSQEVVRVDAKAISSPAGFVAAEGEAAESLTSSEARAYMQQVTVQLRNWNRKPD
jgi:hypothetical protein